jgi:hypothetical protein
MLYAPHVQLDELADAQTDHTFHRLVITLNDSVPIPDKIAALGVQSSIGLRWPL